MAKQDATKVLWKVEARLSRKHAWRSKGIFETRKDAREKCHDLRGDVRIGGQVCYRMDDPGFGFGNTRIVRHVRGQKCARVK